MKTIEIEDGMYEKLIELATEMTTQDPRGTRMPHMFQVQQQKRVYDWGCNGDVRIWVDDGQEIETFKDLCEYMENRNIDFPNVLEFEDIWEDTYATIEWNDSEYDLQEFISEFCPDLQELSYSYEPEYSNHFLTAKACKAHIASNGYHYTQPVDYLNHAWRNPEMDLISTFLCGLVGKPMHT
jgi:hypothetical protein